MGVITIRRQVSPGGILLKVNYMKIYSYCRVATLEQVLENDRDKVWGDIIESSIVHEGVDGRTGQERTVPR